MTASGILAQVERWAMAAPEREALVDEQGSMTYRALAAAALGWAAAMAAAGVGAGDRVLMLAPPGRESLVALLAGEYLGAIWSGADPRLSAEEIAFRVADLAPRLILSFARLGARSYAADVEAARRAHAPDAAVVLIGDKQTPQQAGAIQLQAFLAGSDGVTPPRAADPAAPLLVVYTSGSSGRPKGAMLSAGAIVDFARRQNALWPVAPMRTLNFLPVGHAGSIVDLTVPTLVAGGCVVFEHKFEPLASLRTIERERVSFWGSVPSTFLMQVALPEFGSVDLSSVQLIAIEGAPIPPELAARLVGVAPIATNYGMTESCSAISATAPTRSVDELVDTVGAPFGDAEVRIDAEAGPGEILVRSPRNLLGYWNNPEATRAAFTDDGYLRTGDVGERLPDGRLRLRGRVREMFKSGGYNVYPAEVERVIGAHPDVHEVAVIARPDPLWQEVGVAFVVPRPGAAADRSLAAWCGERLANYKCPKRIEIVDALPLLAVGKVDRTSLRRRAEELG